MKSVLKVQMSGNLRIGQGKVKSSKLKNGKTVFAVYSERGSIISNAYPTKEQAKAQLNIMHRRAASYAKKRKGDIIGYAEE